MVNHNVCSKYDLFKTLKLYNIRSFNSLVKLKNIINYTQAEMKPVKQNKNFNNFLCHNYRNYKYAIKWK